MYRVWLVQRGQLKDIPNDQIEGFNSLIDYDYMGSAEFEFGALPKSLHRIIENWNDFDFVSIDSIHDKNNDILYVYCKKAELNQVNDTINYLISDKCECKQPPQLKRYLYDDSYFNHPKRANFWWDVDNDYFIVFGEKYREQLQIAISKMEMKWNIVRKLPKQPWYKKLFKSK